ncbi:aldo/keto reductase [Fontisphaera persica]|uniref:aldo/keto reductase n=1 Tax=Fontisphaera persica TaxID=2974023 RepID=UPI0024BF2C2E|nr:aldo/keto reductase [Fontisphaera persica]WCJ60465.1 aldo/keto reductase [Fontisphaera persica]
MEITRTAFGTWNGGRFMNFGVPIEEERYQKLVHLAFYRGIRTFITADVYGTGAADELLGRSLRGLPRSEYALVAAIGHDFYQGRREGSKGYPRFTDERLRLPAEYADYLRMATEKCLARVGVDSFDCVLLHNPDYIGYSSEKVWKGMERLMDAGLTNSVGVAPGPANGFTLDLLLNFHRFDGLVKWAMIILNPLEPWPGTLCLRAAQAHGVKTITRVVDCGGLFHDDVKPGHAFPPQDHRVFRPAGWVEEGNRKLELMRPYARKHGLTMLQLASVWNLGHPSVSCVVPTLIEELDGHKSIEQKACELAETPEIKLSEEELTAIEAIGQNRGCMHLKGGNPEHQGAALPDRWGLTPDLELMAQQWGIRPQEDLVCTVATAT